MPSQFSESLPLGKGKTTLLCISWTSTCDAIQACQCRISCFRHPFPHDLVTSSPRSAFFGCLFEKPMRIYASSCLNLLLKRSRECNVASRSTHPSAIQRYQQDSGIIKLSTACRYGAGVVYVPLYSSQSRSGYRPYATNLS
jgi:hypothetical protein